LPLNTFQFGVIRSILLTNNVLIDDFNMKLDIENTIPNNPVESVNYLVIIIGLVCLVFIFLPTVGTQDSNIPNYMHMTFEMKLFASFVLGMVTMVILK